MVRRVQRYEDIAKDVHNSLVRAQNLSPVRKAAAIAAIEYLVEDIAISLKTDNSKFRYDTFFEACGLDGFGKFPTKVIPVKKKK